MLHTTCDFETRQPAPGLEKPAGRRHRAGLADRDAVGTVMDRSESESNGTSRFAPPAEIALRSGP